MITYQARIRGAVGTALLLAFYEGAGPPAWSLSEQKLGLVCVLNNNVIVLDYLYYSVDN